MSRAERTKLGATVAVIALLIAVVGAIVASLGGWPGLVGCVELVFGIAGVGQGVAIATGRLAPRASEAWRDRDSRGK